MSNMAIGGKGRKKNACKSDMRNTQTERSEKGKREQKYLSKEIATALEV